MSGFGEENSSLALNWRSKFASLIQRKTVLLILRSECECEWVNLQKLDIQPETNMVPTLGFQIVWRPSAYGVSK